MNMNSRQIIIHAIQLEDWKIILLCVIVVISPILPILVSAKFSIQIKRNVTGDKKIHEN